LFQGWLYPDILVSKYSKEIFYCIIRARKCPAFLFWIPFVSLYLLEFFNMNWVIGESDCNFSRLSLGYFYSTILHFSISNYTIKWRECQEKNFSNSLINRLAMRVALFFSRNFSTLFVSNPFSNIEESFSSRSEKSLYFMISSPAFST